MGFCDKSSKWSSYMQKYCAKTCEYCSDVGRYTKLDSIIIVCEVLCLRFKNYFHNLFLKCNTFFCNTFRSSVIK